jgi:general secretion pathway protein L
MIRTGTVLDMDMSSLGASLRAGWEWWTGELATLVPERWQGGAQRFSGPVAQLDGDGTLWLDGRELTARANGARRRLIAVELAPEQVMVRQEPLPQLGRRDLDRMVDWEIDRLFPFPPGSGIAAARPIVRREGGGGGAKIPVLIAAMPVSRALAAIEAARDAAVEPLALLWRSPDAPDVTVDLLPALVRGGHIAGRRDGRPFWWGLVALLFAANLALMVWRDVAATEMLRAEVAAQAATTAAARAVATRIARENTARAALIAERKQHDPLAILALTTRVLPETAWVQRYSWTPETLRLTGYKQAGSDVQSALRQSRRFATIQSSVSDATAEGGGGQPFDISADIVAPAKAAKTAKAAKPADVADAAQQGAQP